MTEKERIGFIGLGNMGSRMAGCLLGAGYALAVYDTDAEKVRPFERQAVRTAGTPQELAGMADVIFCSVPDDAALREVVTGLSGVLAPSGPAAFFVNVSTVSPATSRDLAKDAQARGVSMIECENPF